MSDFHLTAKLEYCAACGRELGWSRYLVLSAFSGKYEAIHHSPHCLELFNLLNHSGPLAPSDTSNYAIRGKP